MATIAYELPETYASVSRPVAFEIIKQLRDILGIDNKNIPISVPGANGKITVWNANNVESRDTAQFNGFEKLIVEIKEEYSEDDLMTMMSLKRDTPPIFLDSKYGINIRPVYSRMKAGLSLTYRSKDRYQAESLRDYWRRKIAENREYMIFNARYTYPIPEDIEKGLYLLHRTRMINDKEYPTYQEYLFGLGSPHLTSLKNGAGKGDTLGMAETQEYIQGNFTDPTSMEVEKDEVGAVWTVRFDFEYQYDKPISCVLEYPILIHNELIPWQLYPEQHFDIATLKTHSSYIQENYHAIEQQQGFQWHIRGAYIRIPSFDDWSKNINWMYYKTLLSALVVVDPEDKKYVCNLKDLGDWGLHPVLHDSFKNNALFLVNKQQFPFWVSMYENNAIVEHDALYIDDDLNVYTKYPMKLDKMYHLVISIHKDIRLFEKQYQLNFFKDPQLVYAYLDILLGRVPVGGYPKVNSAGYIDIESYKQTMNMNNIGSKGNYLGLGSAMATVGIFTITTHKQKELNEE